MTNRFDVSKPNYWDWEAVDGNAVPVIKITDANDNVVFEIREFPDYHQEMLDVVTGKVIIVDEP